MDKDIYRICYVDMDGVLANFSKGFYDLSGANADTTPDPEMWKIINDYGRDTFFSELPLMEGAMEMWDFIKNSFLNVKILSALGKSDRVDNKTTKGKTAWLRHHLPDLLSDDIILVDNKHKKRHYSRPHDIIIDDTLVVIQEWINKGGIGIHHKSSFTTIDELKKYV